MFGYFAFSLLTAGKPYWPIIKFLILVESISATKLLSKFCDYHLGLNSGVTINWIINFKQNSIVTSERVKTVLTGAIYLYRAGRNTWRFGNTAVNGTFGVGNLSLSALLARLKAFQLPWSAGL